jgi:ferritin-like metal-binding protein YciE
MAKTSLKTKKPAPSGPRKSHLISSPKSSANPDDEFTELLLAGLRQLYWAENHLVQNLPKIQEAAGNNALRRAVADHWKVTKGHVARLEQIFSILGVAPLAQKCDGMEGLVMEGEGIINSTKPGSDARMAGLIMGCQKVETYEITAYKGLALLAARLDHNDIADLLQATMTEEQAADDTLSKLAQQN